MLGFRLKTAVFGIALMASAPSFAAQVQVLDDRGTAYNFYDDFFTSQRQTVSRLNHDFATTNLAGSKLVITSIPDSFSAGELANLKSYVEGGGRLVLASENAKDGFFIPQIRVVNSALSYLGSKITNHETFYDPDYHTTDDIASNPFTKDVNNIRYASTSSLSGGTTLVRGVSGQDFVSYERIGLGYLFVLADSNLADGLLNNNFGNGQIFLNFENVSISAVPLPASAPLFGAALLAYGAISYGFKRGRKALAA